MHHSQSIGSLLVEENHCCTVSGLQTFKFFQRDNLGEVVYLYHEVNTALPELKNNTKMHTELCQILDVIKVQVIKITNPILGTSHCTQSYT